MERSGVWCEASDAFIRPVLEAYRQAPEGPWWQVLLFLLWPQLTRIGARLRRLSDDPNWVHSQVIWAFLHAVHRLDLQSRPTRLAQKLLNDVLHDVRLHFEQLRLAESQLVSVCKTEEHERGAPPPQLAEEDAAFLWADLRHDLQWGRAYLKSLVRQGRLSRSDYLILVGGCLYGHSLQEMATRLGLSYEATKKRQQRAMKILRQNARKFVP